MTDREPCHLTGVGLWCADWRGFGDLRARLAGETCPTREFEAPKPAVIPKRELRRSPLFVRMGVEAAVQACDMAGVDRRRIPSVFASSMGDTDISAEICRSVNADAPFVSPTKFHNSVHNAAGGYWAIAAGNHASCAFVSGHEHSFATALLNALLQCRTESSPVLLVVEDLATQTPYRDLLPIDAHFAMALVVDPAPRQPGLATLDWTVVPCDGGWPRPADTRLRAMAEDNPAARGLALLEALERPAAAPLRWAVGRGSGIEIAAARARGAPRRNGTPG